MSVVCIHTIVSDLTKICLSFVINSTLVLPSQFLSNSHSYLFDTLPHVQHVTLIVKCSAAYAALWHVQLIPFSVGKLVHFM